MSKSTQKNDFATKFFFEDQFFLKLDALRVTKIHMKFYYGGGAWEPTLTPRLRYLDTNLLFVYLYFFGNGGRGHTLIKDQNFSD